MEYQWSHATPPLLAVDLDDPLADLLDELDLEETKSEAKKFPAKKVEPSPTGSPALRTKEPGLWNMFILVCPCLSLSSDYFHA